MEDVGSVPPMGFLRIISVRTLGITEQGGIFVATSSGGRKNDGKQRKVVPVFIFIGNRWMLRKGCVLFLVRIGANLPMSVQSLC